MTVYKTTASIVVFPGTNRERDIATALQQAGFASQFIWHSDSSLPASDLVVLPGGFAYGDYLRTGAIAAHSPIMREVIAHAKRGGRVLGVCNGFQILCESGLLPGVLLRNSDMKFICKSVHLRVETIANDFTGKYQAQEVITVPVAHGDGNYTADDMTLNMLEEKELVAFRYCGPDGSLSKEYNYNGAARAIAGIFNEQKNVLGMMPHPENAIEALHGKTDGAALFKGIFEALV